MNETELLTAVEAVVVAANAPPPPEPAPTPIWLTHRQVRASLPAIKAKMCRMWHGEYGYITRPGESPTCWAGQDQEKARLMTVETYMEEYGTHNYLCEMLDQETAKRISELPLKLCHFESDLPKLSPLLRLCPNNPTYRALLSQVVREIPPPEFTTYDQLKDWVESNYDPGQNTPSVTRHVLAGMARPVQQEQALFDVDVDLSETEYGRCNYSVNRTGSTSSSYSMIDLARLIEEEDCGSLDDLLRTVCDDATDDAWADADMEGGDYTYDEHESSTTEHENVDLTLSRSELRVRLRNFLLQNASREQLEQLGLDTPF